MQTITEEMKWRQSMVKLAKKEGVTKTARKFRVNRQYVYRWLKRYNGDVRSLANITTKPHHHPNEHTQEEIKLIRDMYKKNKETGLVVFWVKLQQRGYTRSIPSLYREMGKLGIYKKRKLKKKKKVQKYIQPTYPGERVQIDIKYVPQECISEDNLKLYQYTAIDEYTRLRYLQIYEEASTYTSKMFMEEVINNFKFKIKEVRTDNGLQFTNRLVPSEKKTLFEEYLESNNIKHDLIRPFTPKHNGKVERSHRKDSERFYSNHRFYSLIDARKQLKVYNKEYNRFPMKPLGWKSPVEFYNKYKKKAGAEE